MKKDNPSCSRTPQNASRVRSLCRILFRALMLVVATLFVFVKTSQAEAYKYTPVTGTGQWSTGNDWSATMLACGIGTVLLLQKNRRRKI